jgi:hypothetical protein
MDFKYKLGIGILALLTAFAVGRYSVSSPSVSTTENKQVTDNKQTDKDIHEKTTTTSTKKPNGEVQTVTVEVKDIVSKADENTNTREQIQQTVSPTKHNTLNVSGLFALQPSNSLRPLYGVSITKEILGPVTVGVFGLTNSTLGVSIGLSF